MAGEERRGLRFDDTDDPHFQQRWAEARHLTEEQVELAFRHGLDSRDRFADRPFHEVEQYLRQSWEGMGPAAAWDQVQDIIRSGYERYRAADLSVAAELGPDALHHFPDQRTQGGSVLGGSMGERPQLGAAEPVSDYEGEGGPPVEGGPRVS